MKTKKNPWSVGRMSGWIRHQLSLWGVAAFAVWLVFAPIVVMADVRVAPNPFAPNPIPVGHNNYVMRAGIDTLIEIWNNNAATGGDDDGFVWAGGNGTVGSLPATFTWGPPNTTSSRTFRAMQGSLGRATLNIGNRFDGGAGTTTFDIINNSPLEIIAELTGGTTYGTFWINTLSINSGLLMLTRIGRTVLQGSGLTIDSGRIELGSGNLYLFNSNFTATNATINAAPNSNGEVVFSGAGGSIGRAGYRNFLVSESMGGTANLRFTEILVMEIVNLPLIGDLTIHPIVTNVNRTVIRAVDGDDASISNPHIYLDGTQGADAYSLQLINTSNNTSVIPPQNTDSPRRNDNLLYNIVRVHEGPRGTPPVVRDDVLTISSNVHIARINPERYAVTAWNNVFGTWVPTLVPTGATAAHPGRNEFDMASFAHNPRNTHLIPGYEFPLYTGTGYKPWWDPTNNPNSTVFYRNYNLADPTLPRNAGPAGTDGLYNAKYDPSNPIHDPASPFYGPNNPLYFAYYNPTFDPTHSDYNPASNWRTVANGGHIAYNPYVDENGYSGGWTKVDVGVLHLTGVMDRDINSLIDVQGGTLRFNSQANIGMSQNDQFNRTGVAPAPPGTWIFQANPNGTVLANLQADETNYYTIQLNAISNPTVGQPPAADRSNRRATTLWTTSGGMTPVVNGGTPVNINNRIVLHGGGNIRVGDVANPWVPSSGAFVDEDDDWRVYSDNSPRLQGGGVGAFPGYLRLSVTDFTGGNTNPAIRNGATLVGIRPSQDVSPFLNKIGTGVLDLTGVTWEYEEGLTSVEVNVFEGSLAFTDQKDLGAGVISLVGRDAKLLVLTNSLMDVLHGQILTNESSHNGANRDLMINNTLRLVGGGTINVVQGGQELASLAVPVYENPFFTQTDITKTRQGDGYTNQQNLILNMERVVVEGSGWFRKIGLGKLTLENVLTIPAGTDFGFEIQRGTVSFSNPNSLGNRAILFSLDKNATLQYRGTDATVTVNNNILMTYNQIAHNSGGATFDIRHANDPTAATTMRLKGTISGDRNFLTLTKLGDLKSTLDMTEATVQMAGTAGAANWDIRTGTIAFDVQSNLGTGNIALSEATTLHKVYLPVTATQPYNYTPAVAIANNLTFRNNGTLIVDGGAILTLNGQLSVERQMDKLGGGTLILSGTIAKTGLADVGNSINGGLRIKEGSLSFSRREQLVSSETGNPSVSINLYGNKTSLVYTGTGDIDQATQKPRPMVIENNINLLPSWDWLQGNAGATGGRFGVIDVTDATGNLQIAGEKIRGGDLTLNDLNRDANGNPIIGADNKWQTVQYAINGASQLVKRGAGTLTLTGTLNGDVSENVSLFVEQGKLAFSQQENLGANKVVLDGTDAILEYAGAGTNFSINNTIELHNGGGRLSVLDSAATWVLTAGQITAERTNADGTTYSGTWTLGKGGAGTLDLTNVDFNNSLVALSTNTNDKLAKLEIDKGNVRFNSAANLGSATISMGAAAPLAPGLNTYTSGILEYTGVGATTITNNIGLNGGPILSSTGAQMYDPITKRAMKAGGGVNVSQATGTLTLGGLVVGTGNFVKTGTGTLVLTRANSFVGDLIVEGGRLEIAAQQQMGGNGALVVKQGTAAATAANVLSGKEVYLASGTVFDMSTTGANQTLAGVFKYAIAGGGKTLVWVSNPVITGSNCNNPHDTANPIPTGLGNTLTLAQLANTRSVIDMIYGNTGSTLIVDRGYLTVDLDHFHGTTGTLNGGTIINIGKSSGERGDVEVTQNGSNDVGTWVSGDVTLSQNSHITVGYSIDPEVTGDGSWQSGNVIVTGNSTIDIKNDWLISQRTTVDPINVLVEGKSRISVGNDWVQSGSIVIDDSHFYVGGYWTHDENGLPVNGMWDTTRNGYVYNEGGINNLTWHMGLGDFSAIDFVSGAANPYSTVTIRNGGVALVGGNWESGAVNVTGGSTVVVGHTDPVTGNLVAQTGNFDTYGEKVVVTGSDVTVLGDWASGDVVITGNSDVSVGMWNGLRPTGNGNMTITGDFNLTGVLGSSFRAAGTIDADNVTINNSQSTIIGGGLAALEDIRVTGSSIGVGGNATAQNLVLSTTTANITGNVTAGNAFGHGTTLFTTSDVTVGSNLTTDTLLISNTATNVTQVGKNVTVDGAARIYGGTVNVAGNWNSGIHANILNPTTTLRNDVVLDGTRLRVMGNFSANSDAVTAMDSIVTVGKNWNSGITTLTDTEANVGVNFDSGELTVAGMTTSGKDNLTVGGSLDVDGQVVIASVRNGAASTSVSVAKNWTSDDVYTSGSNSKISVGQDWNSSAIDTDGGSFTIGGSMTTSGAGINSNYTEWNVVTGNWNSGNVTLKNGYANVGGNFTAGDVKLTNVTLMKTGGDWNSGVVSSNFTSTEGESVFNIGGKWNSGQLTVNGGKNIGRFIIDGDVNIDGSVRTTSMDWNVNGNWSAGGNPVDIRTANNISTQNWTSGTTSLTDVSRLVATGNWTSDSLYLDAGGMDMSIGGNFDPGSAIGFGMQSSVKLNSLAPVYNIVVGGNTNLGGTLISVTGAKNLLANGRYYISSITSTGGTINANDLRVSNLSLFKKVDWDMNDAATQLDVYVDSQGFQSYATRIGELGLGKLSHNQLEVVNNFARAEKNITDFEVAATSQPNSFNANAVTTAPMRDNAVVKDVLDRIVAYGDNETIAANTRATNISRCITQLSGETYANSMFLASTRPWMSALDRTRLDNSIYFTGIDYAADMQAVRGQARSIAKMNRVWITPEYSFDAISSDGNARSADIGRLGFSMGIDRRIRQNATAGLLFGFNNGRLNQDEDRFQAGDFQIGAYASAMVGYYIELRSFLGCGWQNYESNRVVDMTFAGGTRRAAAGRANGQSFSGTLEAARPLFFGVFILKPTVALDVSSYARDAFTETGDSIRLNVGRTTYTRVAPRVGATWETDPMKRFAATTRLFAGYNFGDDHVVTKTQFVSFGGASQNVYSTVIGRCFLDAGLGARYHANAARTMSFHGNFDMMAADRSFSGAFSIGGTWMY